MASELNFLLKRSKAPKLHTDNNDMSRIVQVFILFCNFFFARFLFVFAIFSLRYNWPSTELDHHFNHHVEFYKSVNCPQVLEKIYKPRDMTIYMITNMIKNITIITILRLWSRSTQQETGHPLTLVRHPKKV